MVKSGSLILVHFVEQQLEGWTFKRSHWPLHITLVPWFMVADEEAVVRSLDRVAEQTKPQRLKVGAQKRFGVEPGRPVNVISNQTPVYKLHKALVETLVDADIAFHEAKFIGKAFVAHIVRHETDNRHSNEGEEVPVSEFHLVRLLEDDTCRVEQQFDLLRSRA